MKGALWTLVILGIGIGIGLYVSKKEVGEAAGIGVNYDQAMHGLARFFEMEGAELADGRTRHMSAASETKAILELLGSKARLERAALVVWLPLDDEQRERFHLNRTILFRFLDNTVPAMKGDYAWRTKSLEAMEAGTQTHAEKTLGGVRVRLRYDDELKMLHAFVEYGDGE